MRRIWISLLLLGVVPACLFFLFKWTGGVESLRFVSTTRWETGDPAVLDLFCLFGSMVSWAWLRGFIYLFVGAAIPFLVADVVTVTLRRRRTN